MTDRRTFSTFASLTAATACEFRRPRLSHWIVVCVVTLGLSPTHRAQAADAELRKACASLATPSTERFKDETAEWVGASRLPSGPAGATVEVPDHCLFRVTLDPRPSGLEDMRYGTGIELRLPANWKAFQGASLATLARRCRCRT